MYMSLRPNPTALLNPLADPIFKSLFTQNTKESRAALTGFLETILKKKITNIVLQPNELASESIYDRQTEFDLTCLADNEPVNIEMQGVNVHNCYQNRAEYHVARLLNHYMQKGSKFSQIPKTYQISVVNFYIDDSKDIFNHYVMKNKYNNILGERLNIIFIELPKIQKLPDDVNSLTDLEVWGKFLLNGSDPEKKDFIKQIGNKNPGVKNAMDALQFLSKEEAEWQRENSHWRFVSDYNTGMSEATEKGIQQGKEEASIQIAKKLKESGNLTAEQIIQATGISEEEYHSM